MLGTTAGNQLIAYNGSSWAAVGNTTLTDNTTDALDYQEGTNNYLNINTTNSSENISFGNATTNPSFSFLGTGTVTIAGALDVSGGSITLQNDETIANSANGTITLAAAGQTNNEDITLDLETTANQITIGTGTGVTIWDFGTIDLATDAIDLSEGNITNAGDISLDSLTSDSTTITIGGTPGIVLTDNTTIVMTLGDDAGDDFSVDATAFVVEGDTGNVGIGTASPTSPLQVEGQIHAKGGIKFNDNRTQATAGPSAIAVKSSDQSVTSSTTLTDATDLSFTVGANETWVFDLYLFYVAHSSGDLKLGWTVPAGTTGEWGGSYEDSNGTHQDLSTVYSDTFGVKGLTGNSLLLPRFHGLVITAGTAGTVQLQFAQQTSNGTATTIHAGSTIIAYKVSQ